ncbi:MAG: lysozyme inhibitor LprI family protein [Candidatus Thiothrix sulfatifontis]|nr:MAG: lysozyme inhibitor LprI family protein [Candidatus Thiothrix sulfatifontis]
MLFIKDGEVVLYLKYTISFLYLLMVGSFCFAVDDPNDLDLIKEFELRCKKYAIVINEEADTDHEISIKNKEYMLFLDKELNSAYMKLIALLDEKSKKKLVFSQRQWLRFRDAEFGFIVNNWTIKDFGSSSAISRDAYRTVLVKNRIIEILSYLQNY